MAAKEIENPFDEGINALSAGNHVLALSCFKRAVAHAQTPIACSYLAYCQARIDRTYKDAINVCMEARKEDPKNSDIYLLLGRLYLLVGNKKQAIQVFRLGLRQEKNGRIANELNALGLRKDPPIRFLERSHPINKYLGKILTMFWLR